MDFDYEIVCENSSVYAVTAKDDDDDTLTHSRPFSTENSSPLAMLAGSRLAVQL